MTSPTSHQRDLAAAIAGNNIGLAGFFLQKGADPNFFFIDGDETPLSEAVRNHNPGIVRLLIENGADMSLAKPGRPTPYQLAEDIADVTNDYSVFSYLEEEKSKKDQFVNNDPSPTARKLKDAFDPVRWGGRVAEMKKAWEDVPGYRKKDFDFDAVLSVVRRQALKEKADRFRSL